MDHKSRFTIITNNKTFRSQLDSLKTGDVLIGLLNIKPTEEYLFLDLIERGINIYPSALSQLISRSKCLQASIYKHLMLPNTTVARDRHDMIKLINDYGEKGIQEVITKQNRFNCGLGIHKWPSIEDAYNQACFGTLDYPFVVQPLEKDIKDIRVIILGDYIEAYWRFNPNSFRNNLFFGGNSGNYNLTDQQLDMCHEIMERGKFPYAHIDLMVKDNGDTYLSEINLRGGLKGAKISTPEYKQRIQDIHIAYKHSHQDNKK